MVQIIDPSPIGYNEVSLSWIVGRRVVKVTFSEPTLWAFHLGQGDYIGAECLWRIIKADRVALTREDHCQKFGLRAPIDAASRAAELLSGLAITAVQLREATADVLIEFAGDLRLEVIPDSSGYES